MADEVELVPYNADWPKKYEAELARLHAGLPSDLILGAEHFGSTAIPGMPAKPVIDILLAVSSVDAARAAAPRPMAALGYAFWSENPRRDRLFFVRGLPPAPSRTHHVHMAEPGSDLWQGLLFRDHLRAHNEYAVRYAALKRDLAARHATDREAYTSGKANFVAEVLARARPGVG